MTQPLDTPLIVTNRHLLVELQAIRLGLELLLLHRTGDEVNLLAMAKDGQSLAKGVSDSPSSPNPLTADYITYDRDAESIAAEEFEETQTDAQFVAAVGGFKGWRPSIRIE